MYRNTLLAIVFATFITAGTTANADCQDQCRCGIRLNADLLYWNPCTEGLSIALSRKLNETEKVNRHRFNERKHFIVDNNGNEILEVAFAENEYFNPVNFTESVDLRERGKFLDDGSQLGVRIGLHYENPCSCIGVGFNWTNFSPSSHKNVRASNTDPSESIVPFNGLVLEKYLTKALLTMPEHQVRDFSLGTSPDVLNDEVASPLNVFENPIPLNLRGNSARATWDLDLNLFDLEFSSELECNCVSFRPHAAIRFAKIKQTLSVKSDGAIFARMKDFSINEDFFEVGYATYIAKQSFKTDFDGVGPRFGIESHWDAFCGFGLYGNIATSLLYGSRETSHKETASRETMTERDTFERIFPDFYQDGSSISDRDLGARRRNDEDCVAFVTDLALGITWDWCFCGDAAGLSMKLGWEHHYFFNQGIHHALEGITDVSGGNRDLSTHGLVFSAAVGF